MADAADVLSPAEHRALRAAAAEHVLHCRRRGEPTSAVLHAAIRRLDCLLTSGIADSGNRIEPAARQSNTDWLGVPEAAALLGCTHRRVRQLAPRLGGRKHGRAWQFPRELLEEHRSGC